VVAQQQGQRAAATEEFAQGRAALERYVQEKRSRSAS